ncbi:MAG TPA: ABC transporter permease [Vicinamibacterales bacterium]|nr:ABC transporter permease [Vicinamibacterales bacterium]
MSDLRDAFRALRATPVVTVVAILSLALGIGANTAIFSILNSLILKTLPVKEPQALALLTIGPARSSWTYPQWEQLRRHAHLVDGALVWSGTRFNLAPGGQSEMVDGLWASGRYFDVLGVQPLIGRTFSEADDRRGGGPDGPVAVISYTFWQRRFGGAADAVGRSLTVERVPFTIVGVTPPDFFGVDVGSTFDVAIPLGTEPLIRGKDSALDRRSTWWLRVMVRLKEGQGLEATQTALRGVQPQVRDATVPENWRPEDRKTYLAEPFTLSEAATGTSRLRARYQRPLTTMMVVVGLVLLIACANIANLLLARATARRHEISVRLALGATRARLMRQLLSESLVLSACGALLGLLFAQWGSRLLVRQLSTSTVNVVLELGLDWRILGFTTLVAVTTALLFGAAPALRASRVPPNEALKEQGRGLSADRRFGLGNLLVVAQVALSLILIVAAGLFMRTFASLANLDLGFQRDPVLIVSVNAQAVEPTQRMEVFEQVRQAAVAVPGVHASSLSVVTPVSGSTWNNLFEFPDHPDLPERERIVNVNIVAPDFFKTLGTRMIAGRDFSQADRRGAPPVAIVNESFARKYFNGETPIGRRVGEASFPDRPGVTREIVGYVQNAAYGSLREPLSPTIYFPVSQRTEPLTSINLSVRSSSGSPALLIKPLAAAIGGANRGLAFSFRPLAEQVNASLIQERLVAMLSGFFGGLALVLAGLGLYGVTSYAVSRRRTELGIRMALGAAPGGVVRLVLRRVAALVTLGIIVGGAAALYASTFVSTLLYGLEPRDPVTFSGAAVILAAIGALAGWIPARRASRIDPAVVLRQ